MNTKTNLIIVGVLLIATIAIVSCGGSATPTATAPASSPTVLPTAAPGIANPASVHCVQNGGQVQFRQDAQGGTLGICVFPDKSECEEWAFYRGECKPGDKPAASTRTP